MTGTSKKVLILNCMCKDMVADSFNIAIRRPLTEKGIQADDLRVSKLTALPDLSPYSHVILSGSEACILDENPWDNVLADTVRKTLELRKPLLGFCYGHQFIARTLQGKDAVKKNNPPEMGWIDINFKENWIFKGIKPPFRCMVSHYDAVHNLGPDFTVIASTPDCPVHGYQYKDLPVWGLQFHPEYQQKEGDEIFEILSVTEPNFDNYYTGDLEDYSVLAQNDLVLENFIASKWK